MIELVCKFISNYMTITSSIIQSALLAAMCHLSIVVFLIYYLLTIVKITSPLFVINFFGGILSLLITAIVSWCQCLVSKNGFDLIEMHPCNSLQSNQLHHTSNLVSCHSQPDLHSHRPSHISSSNLSSHLANQYQTSHSSQHLSLSQPLHQASSSLNSQQYWYQVALSDSNVYRKSSAAAVIAYKIKYRLESIVSILK